MKKYAWCNPEICFYLSLSFMFTHELDAIQKHEWRILPPFSFIKDDKLSASLFIYLHAPLFLLFLLLVSSRGKSAEIDKSHSNTFTSKIRFFLKNNAFVLLYDMFAVAHLIAHVALRKIPLYEFNNWFSFSIIISSAVFSILDAAIQVALFLSTTE